MEEKNVQNKAELNEEQMEQTAGGGVPYRTLKNILCRKCGKSHLFAAGATIGSFTCECGAELHG